MEKQKLVLAIVGGIACGMLAPRCVFAQEPGERVRVTLPSDRFVGVVAEASPTEIVLAMVSDEDGGLRIVPHDEIRRLERSLGMRRRGMGKWAVYGALGGAGFGALSGSGALGEVQCGGGLLGGGRDCSGEASTIAGLALGFGVLGVAGGTLYGWLAKMEAWETIEAGDSEGMSPRLLFDVATGPDGLASLMIGGQLRF
ncbi:hypothetical protein [Candidatus Palauibacter sp.]|uniref:hypothetical protein n=1 Tax=Candidatus Palauibacter sp. TaxID=3101350 RepID=UPI003B51F5A7